MSEFYIICRFLIYVSTSVVKFYLVQHEMCGNPDNTLLRRVKLVVRGNITGNRLILTRSTGAVAGLLAARHPAAGAGHQLGPGSRVTLQVPVVMEQQCYLLSREAILISEGLHP